MKATKYILAAVIAASLTSCGNDWLDLEPSTSEKTENTIKVLSDCDFALNSIYSTMQSAYAYSGRMVYYGDVLGDDMQANGSSKRSGSYYLMKFTEESSPYTFWYYPYYMISGCNMILNKIDDLATDNKDLRNYYKGQALALRGLFLFDMTKFYGYPYKKDNGASLGVPIVKTLLEKEAKPSRNTVKECYESVIQDLKDAISLMDNKYGNSFAKGHISRWAVMSLLSRVYLYHGDDALALQMAEEAISGAEKKGWRLWTNAEYPTAWSNDVSKDAPGEILFEIVNTTDDSPGKESLGRLHSPDGYSDIIATSSFYVMMQEDKNDVRNKLFITSDGVAYVHKYQGQQGELDQDANIPLIRLSETYLNAAEAAFKTGDKAKAVKYLNAIVSRANPEKSVSESEITLDRIMTERRKELVAEGHRMFDALRDGGYVDRHDAEKIPSDIKETMHLSGITDGSTKYNWDHFRCVLPVPKSEIDVNDNIKQNPSY